MGFNELSFDYEEFLSEIRRAQQEASERRDLQQQHQPSLASTAAGRDFVDLGRRLQQAFCRVHATGIHRLDRIHDVLQKDADQARTIRDEDSDFSGRFTGDGS